jgi:transposase
MQGYDCEAVESGAAVHLVCGATCVGNADADILCTIISARLGMNPFSGDVFAFCGVSRDRIKYIRWDGSGFEVFKRRREYGRYYWPQERLGQTIRVTSAEFEYVLRGCEQRE